MVEGLDRRFAEIGVEELTIERVALSKDDVVTYNLPKNPFKPKDTRAEWYIQKYDINYAVELDALPPHILQEKLEESILNLSILNLIDLDVLEECKKRDEEEKSVWIERIAEMD